MLYIPTATCNHQKITGFVLFGGIFALLFIELSGGSFRLAENNDEVNFALSKHISLI